MAWFRKWFNHHYLRVYSHRDKREAAEDVRKVEKLLPLRKKQPILDLACGSGRHAVELASRGYKVVGLDLSSTLLKVALESAEAAGVQLPLVRGDVRSIPFADTFGCVLNFFTSFGYFKDEEENLEVLASIRRCLIPGGCFMIDHINTEKAINSLVPEDRSEIGGLAVIQRRRFDAKTRRIEKTIILRENGERTAYEESVRLYSLDEFSGMINGAGLLIRSVCGGLDGSPFAPDAPRMVVIGEKPG